MLTTDLLTVAGQFFCNARFLPADGSASVGLPVLRGVQNPVPRRSDADPPQRGADPTGPVAAGRLPDLQADHTRHICGQLPQLHAGREAKPKRRRRSPKMFLNGFKHFFFFYLFRKSLLNQGAFLHPP